MQTSSLVTVSLALACALNCPVAVADPQPSQHPRVGQLAELTFAPGSAKLALDIAGELREVATWAHEHPDGLLVIDGHADRTGPATANVRLSLDRAKAVRGVLVAAGVAPDQIVIAAFGEDAPQRAGNNRRVIVWGTRAGLDAVIARTLGRGHAVIWSGFMTTLDHEPQVGVVARR
jgi:hypothetical protein